MNIAGLWDQLVLAVCRPPRDLYAGEDDLVGGRRAVFRLGRSRFYRQDVVLVNPRGQKLQASHYRPCVVTSRDGALPCVIYCHCNSGSRRDAEEILYHLLPKSVTVFALDFAGSGLSEGGYVTLGAHEVEDLATAVQYLRDEGGTSTIGLWGRSMGAVTALLYSQRDPSIAGMVLDSPFSRLSDLMMELAMDQQLRIPKPLIKVALAMMRRSVRKRAGFDIDEVAPLDHAAESYISALFGHARDDTFVNKHHSERLFAAHSGDKNFITFDGDHNSMRPDFFYDSALIFLLQVLRVQELVGPGVDLQIPEDLELPRMSGESGYTSRSSQTNTPRAAEAGSAGGSLPGSPGINRRLSPPWDRALMPGHSRHASQDQEQLAAAAAEADLEQEHDRGAAGAGAGTGGRQLQHESAGMQASPRHRWAPTRLPQVQESQVAAEAAVAAGADPDSLDEEAALQRALELSLRDMQQAAAAAGSAQQEGGGEGEAAAAEHRRYNPLYATSGPANPLYAGSAGAEVPHSREDEEAMLAQAIAESLRLQSAEQEAAGQQQQQQPDAGVATMAASPFSRPEQPALLSSDLRSAQLAAGAGPAGEVGSSGSGSARQGHSAHSAAAQGSAVQHSQQEAAVARAASMELRHALSGVAAAAATTAGTGSSPGSPLAATAGGGTRPPGPELGPTPGEGGPVDEEAQLQRLREQAAGMASPKGSLQ